jgi:hypothetical protein
MGVDLLAENARHALRPGCHRGPDKASYHCHQGQFAGRTFKSKDDYLRELRDGKSQRLAPKSNQPPFEKKADE